MAFQFRKTQWDIKELNKGARDEGFKSWKDFKYADIDAEEKRVLSQKILRNLDRNNGRYVPPMTVAERVAIASQAQVKHTWASVTKEYPDFKDAMKEYLDNRTTKPELKKINKLKISPEKKWDMMSGKQKQFILKFNRRQFQVFKNSITVPEMGELSKFKSIRDVLVPVSANSYNYKNGVVVLDPKFYSANRAKLFQDYLKQEGMERLAIPVEGAKGERFKGRWVLTDKAIKEGKTFASIIGAYPNLKGTPSTIYNNILANVTKDHPVYKDTQQGLRSLFNFVKDSINSDMRALKPGALRTLVENNPTLLKQVTGYVDPVSKTINYQGVAGLKNLSTEEILNRARLITEHNRPMRDYASKYMDKDRLKVLAKNLRKIDADMTHNISLASQWYNNSLKESATNLAEANKNNPKVLEHVSNEFKKMNQRIYVGGKFYGAELATSPKYTKSIVDFWRNNLKDTGLQPLWDKYVGQYNKRGFGTIDNILNKTLKDPNALKQIGAFFGCPTTFKQFDEGGRVRLQAGGQGLAQCVDTKLKQPGAMEKLAALPEEVGGTLGKLKNATRGFLSLLGRGGVKAAPLAAVAAVGAAAEPLVKQFRNDDPSTYLSNPEQQKGMLLSLVEQETPTVDEEILKWQYPGQIAGAAAAIPGSSAMYKARRRPFKSIKRGIDRAAMGVPRAALGPVGKFLAGSFSPLGVAASLPVGIAAQRAGGTEYKDIATDPLNWVGPAFASAGSEMATKGVRNPLLLKALRLGMSPRALMLGSRFLGLPGLALTAGMWGYDKWKNRD
jgi:hypothetical protein